MKQHLDSDLIIDYIHRELSAADDAAVYAHLGTCEACRALYEREVALGEELRVTAAADERELPGMVKALVWEAVRNERPSSAAVMARWLRPAFAVPVAAVLAFFLYLAAPFGPLKAQPTIDATYYLEQHAAQQGASPFVERGSAQGIETSMLESSQPDLPYSSPDDRTVATIGSLDVLR